MRLGYAVTTTRFRRQGPEKGFTIVEMSVAMLIMAVVMSLVTTGMDHLINPTLQTESLRNASGQLNDAFLQLDSEVRYASAVWTPVTGPANDFEVVFESTFEGSATPTCTQLRYSYVNGTLLQASWPTGQAAEPPFKVIASGLATSATTPAEPDPFVIVSNPNYQKVQLEVELSAIVGGSGAITTTSSSVTFTALNSTGNGASTDAVSCPAWTV
jgi:prepilin-type N-terminal cleavage/methylation domain-containing protein